MTGGIDLLENIQGADLSPFSKRNYQDRISAICRKAGVDVSRIAEIAENPDKYIPLFRSKHWYPNPTSLKVHYSAILGLFKYNPEWACANLANKEKWADAFRAAKELVTERYENNRPSERQADGYVPFGEIVEARDALEPGSKERLLLALYTHIPPMRCEYARMPIYYGEAEGAEPNYVLLPKSARSTKGWLVFDDYKTKKTHGRKEVAMPKELVAEIRASLRAKPRAWLFTDKNGEPYTRKAYSFWAANALQAIFGRPLTISLIRHSFINTIDFNTSSIREKKDIADAMGHTVDMQDQYRLIFDADRTKKQ